MKTKDSRTRTTAKSAAGKTRKRKTRISPLRKLLGIAEAAYEDVPTLVDRVQIETEMHGKSYEEANWPKLSPMFRKAHNSLRVAKGLSPIPEPKIDLWVPPAMRKGEKFDP